MRLTRFPSALAALPLPPHGTATPGLRRAGRVAAVAGLGLAAILGVAIAVVLAGPTEVGLIRDRAVAALSEALGPDYSVTAGKAVIDVDPVLGLAVGISDVEVRDGSGAPVAKAATARLAVDPVALLTFRVRVTQVEVTGADVSLVRRRNGDVFLGTAHTAPSVEAPAGAPPPSADPAGGGGPNLVAAAEILNRGMEIPLRAAGQAGLSKLSLVGGRLALWDAERLEQRVFANTDLTLSTGRPGDVTGSVSASGYGGRWTASFERDVSGRSGEGRLTAMISQISLADIFPVLGQNADFVGADVPLYGRGSVDFDRDGRVRAAVLRLDVGAGEFRLGNRPEESVMLDEATVRLRWDSQSRVVTVEPSSFYFGDTRALMSGSVREEDGPAGPRYAFDLESRGAILAPRDSNEPPLVADRIGIAGKFDPAARFVEISNLSVATPSGSAAAAGSVGFDGETPSVALAASFSSMPIATLKQIWPPFIAGGARRWVLDNITGGMMSAGKLEAAIPGGVLWGPNDPEMPADALRLDIRLDKTSFRTFGGLPDIVNASGNVVLAGSTLGVDLEGGEAYVPSGEKVTIPSGAFAIEDVFRRNPEGLIEAAISGSAGALGQIANADPLKVLDRRGMAPADLSGQAEAAVSLRLPLRDDVTDADIDWRVTVKGERLASLTPIDGRTFSKANVTIAVTPAEVTVNGKADIDGVAADVAIVQPLDTAGMAAGTGQQVARLTLDQAARKRLGIGLDDVLGGTVSALVSAVDGGQRFDLDLKQARLTIPGVGWSKGVGVPGRLTFDLKPREGGYRAENVVLAGDGFGFTGTAILNADYGLVSADLSDFYLRPGDSVAVKLTGTKTGYTISAQGASFDVRGAIAAAKGESHGDGDMPDITLDAVIDRITGHHGAAMTGAKLSLVIANGSPRKVAFSGTVGTGNVEVDYTDNKNGASLKAAAADAGGVLRFLDVYERIAGGQLTVAGARSGASGALSGFAEIAGFDVANEPAMLQAASAGGLDAAGVPVDPSRARFDRLVAQFRKTGEAITVDDAFLRGSAAAATFNGRFDLARDTVAINGTYIPAYTVNNLFGRLPLIGRVLGGEQGGLIGVTFRVEGPMAAPQAYFNPLSAVTPGIFRKIFEFR